MRKNVWLLCSVLLLLACDKEGAVPDLGHDYFPIEFGTYRIYDVTETTYVNKVATTEEYQLRERFTEQIGDEANPAYLLLIERREDAEGVWEAVESIYIRQNDYMLEYREDNVSFVKMSYPVRAGREWNGNALNAEPSATYFYESTNESSFEGDEIKVVISDIPQNFVEEDRRFEYYVRGIGLVKRDFRQLEICFQTNCTGANQPENGRILVQELIEYGSE